MRKSFDGLHQLVREHLELDAFGGHLFVFASRRRDRLKILYWTATDLRYGQTIRGRDVRDAAGGERGGTPAGDYSTGVGGPAEWNRPEPGRAAQAISALAINMLIFVRFCLSNSQSVSTLMEKTHLRGHRLTTSPRRSEDPAEDGAGSDGPTGSRVC